MPRIVAAGAATTRWVYRVLTGERHLRRTLNEYAAHYNAERPHQGLSNRLVTPRDGEPPNHGAVIADERLGGLLRSYRRVA